MPIYEFLCEKCSLRFEIFERNTGAEKIVCPKCGTGEIKRLFSTFGFSSGGKFVSSSSKETACSTCHIKNCVSCG